MSGAAIPTIPKLDSQTTTSTRRGTTILKIAATLFAVALVIYWVNWRDVAAAAQRLSMPALALMLGMAIPVHYFQFQRWNILARQAGSRVATSDIHRGYWVGFTLGFLTPGRVGQFGRAFALRDCSAARALGVTILERFYAAVVINGFGLVALAILPALNWSIDVGGPSDTIRLFCLISGASIVCIGLIPFVLKRPFLALSRRLPFTQKTEKVIHILDSVTVGRSTLLLLLAVAATTFTLFQYVVCLRAMGTPLPWFAGTLAALLTLFLKGMLPITMGSLGIGEWSAMICFQGLGVPGPDAVATSLIVFSMNVLIPSLIGAPFLSQLRIPSFNTRWATEPPR